MGGRWKRDEDHRKIKFLERFSTKADKSTPSFLLFVTRHDLHFTAVYITRLKDTNMGNMGNSVESNSHSIQQQPTLPTCSTGTSTCTSTETKTMNDDDALLVDVLEVWTRPLNSVAAAFGIHSFCVVRLKDQTYRMIEKHHDGNVEEKKLERKDILDLALKKARFVYKKDRSAFRKSNTLKKKVTWGTLRQIGREHHGGYDIHSSNCHRLTAALWNAAVVKKKIMKNPMQSKLTKIAQLIGIGASVRVPEIGIEHEVVA